MKLVNFQPESVKQRLRSNSRELIAFACSIGYVKKYESADTDDKLIEECKLASEFILDAEDES